MSDSSSQPRHLRRQSSSMRNRRFTMRLTPEQKELFERAAAFAGQTLAQFVLNAAQRAAIATVHEHEIITLSLRDSRAVIEALEHPTPAGPALRHAAKRYKELMGDG